jgi:hypothetical protein
MSPVVYGIAKLVSIILFAAGVISLVWQSVSGFSRVWIPVACFVVGVVLWLALVAPTNREHKKIFGR